MQPPLVLSFIKAQLKAESTAAETKAPVVTIHVHAFEGSKSRPPESLISLFKVVVVTFIRGAKLGTHVVVVGIQLVSIELLVRDGTRVSSRPSWRRVGDL